jgi:hypothetical protein
MVGQLEGVPQWVTQGHAPVGKVEVLNADSTSVACLIQTIEEAGKIHLPLGGPRLRHTFAGLAQLHARSQVDEIARIIAPRRHVTGVERDTEPWHFGDKPANIRHRLENPECGWLHPRSGRGSKRGHGRVPRRGRSWNCSRETRVRLRTKPLTHRQGQDLRRFGLSGGKVEKAETEFSRQSCHGRDAQTQRSENRTHDPQGKPTHKQYYVVSLWNAA